MIDFMIIGLPRSGTTWAANFFTTEFAHCYHDPLYHTHYSEWDNLKKPNKVTGISCTGIWQFPEWVNEHPAKKVILHRDLAEVNASLDAIGMPPCDDTGPLKLGSITGLHVQHFHLFDPCTVAVIHSYLLGVPVDLDRHAELVQIEMQPNFHGLTVGKDVTKRLMAEVMAIAREQV